MHIDGELLLTIEEVADATRLSTRTIRRAAESGALATVRIGRSVRFRSCDVREFVDAHRSSMPDDRVAMEA